MEGRKIRNNVTMLEVRLSCYDMKSLQSVHDVRSIVYTCAEQPVKSLVTDDVADILWDKFPGVIGHEVQR